MFNLIIKSMNCISCVHNIEDALREHDPQVKLTSEIKKKQIFIETSLSASNTKKFIEEAGYAVDELTEG